MNEMSRRICWEKQENYFKMSSDEFLLSICYLLNLLVQNLVLIFC